MGKISKILIQNVEDSLFIEGDKIHAIAATKEFIFDLKSVKNVAIITTDMGPMYCDMALAVTIEDEVAIFIMSDHPQYSTFLFDQLGKKLSIDYLKIIEGCACLDNKVFEIYNRDSARQADRKASQKTSAIMKLMNRIKKIFIQEGMELPIPTHLKPYFSVIESEKSEYEVSGVIHCDCNCEEFEVWESNNRQIVKLICKKCGKEIVVFDAGKHGWNGFVCKDDFLDRSMIPKKYVCPECNHDAFKVSVSISSQGKEDFIDECVSNDDSFSEEDWVNGFEWMGISLSCTNCATEETDWADLETM